MMTGPARLSRNMQRAIIAGAIAGAGFFLFYRLGQRPPNYITALNPVGILLFFPAVGALGAFAADELGKASRAARYGAAAGAIAGAMASLTLIILHNYATYIHGASIDIAALFRDLLYYIIAGGMLTAIIAAITLAMGAAGAVVLSFIAQFFGTILHSGMHRR